ncbi:MAG: Z1 domain-containing protein [Microbacterium sp.]|uniref:Z1 domain-containing protein n=1 Tax=Microbacterium sp. TaxID=51671 RepID=UPI003D700903
MSERDRLDEILAAKLDKPTRDGIWASAESILDRYEVASDSTTNTGLALGFVQSGKTTSITALAATAADEGFQVIVALLGSTNLLLDQNKSRLEESLGIGARTDYVWVSETNPVTVSAGKRLLDFVDRGRVCLVPVLKHAGRIQAVAAQLEKLPNSVKVLVIDDEADQASLNTAQNTESRTYSAIKELRDAVPNHLYVQYTATPYAPLLLDSADILSPQFVEFLTPGAAYTGGKEFFIDHAATVVRNVPVLDEQASKTPPLQLQGSLLEALASFLAGATLLLLHEQSSPPISMLVHSTARNDVQARYEFLIKRQVSQWKRSVVLGDPSTLPGAIVRERQRLTSHGIDDVEDELFIRKLTVVLREATIWLVNSAADVNKVDWNVAPIHILVGGNKLDRGFTIEGLTVTYMNRPASPQVDTLEQRARAFGYRGDLLAYCQFFGSRRTIRSLTEIVHTEEDLRARLHDHIEEGGSVRTWSEEIGLLLPEGMAPTRASVVQALSTQALGWHSQRKPVLNSEETAQNFDLLRRIGLLDAEYVDHGRRSFRTMRVADGGKLESVLQEWRTSEYSAGWLHDEFVEAFKRKFDQLGVATLMLMEDDGRARVRKWNEEIGFLNLFQGRDLRTPADGSFYPGDRNVLDLENNPDQIILQAHRVVIRDARPEQVVLPLAIYLGSGKVVRKGSNV